MEWPRLSIGREELFICGEPEGRVDSARFGCRVRAVESVRPACRGACEHHLELATEEPGVVGARKDPESNPTARLTGPAPLGPLIEPRDNCCRCHSSRS